MSNYEFDFDEPEATREELVNVLKEFEGLTEEDREIIIKLYYQVCNAMKYYFSARDIRHFAMYACDFGDLEFFLSNFIKVKRLDAEDKGKYDTAKYRNKIWGESEG